MKFSIKCIATTGTQIVTRTVNFITPLGRVIITFDGQGKKLLFFADDKNLAILLTLESGVRGACGGNKEAVFALCYWFECRCCCFHTYVCALLTISN